MNIAPGGGGGYAPLPEEIGASAYNDAQAAMAQLSALPATQDDYAKGNTKLIDQRIALEDRVTNDVSNISATNERNISATNERQPVSAELKTATQDLYQALQAELAQDDNNASGADPHGNKPLTMAAYTRDHDSGDVLEGLQKGDMPDAIPLEETRSFMKEVDDLGSDIQLNLDTYKSSQGPARDAAKAQLLGADRARLTDLENKIHQQAGHEGAMDGITGPKIKALSGGDDAQKTAYIAQTDALLDLLKPDGGALFNDSIKLTLFSDSLTQTEAAPN